MAESTKTETAPAEAKTSAKAAAAEAKAATEAESQLGSGTSDFKPVTLRKGDVEKEAISQREVYALQFDGYTVVTD